MLLYFACSFHKDSLTIFQLVRSFQCRHLSPAFVTYYLLIVDKYLTSFILNFLVYKEVRIYLIGLVTKQKMQNATKAFS